MRKVKQIIIFIIIALLINSVVFALLTERGSLYIFDIGRNLCARSIQVDNEYSDYAFFSSILKRNMIFLIQYENITSGDIKYIIDFIKYLNGETELKYIIDEISFAAGQMLNIYLQTGDENILNNIFEAAGDKEIFSDIRRNYITKLYEYNKSLPDAEKLKYFGVDTEDQTKAHSVLYLDFLIEKNKNKVIPSTIQNVLNGDRSDLDEYFNDIRISLENNEPLYKELFVEDYFNFSFLIYNYFTDKTSDNIRQQTMAVNLKRLYDKNIRGKYFGIFTNTDFIDKITFIADEIYNKTEVIEMHYELWFNEPDKKGVMFSVNNKYFKYLLKYLAFIKKINGQPAIQNNYGDSDAFFVINENRG